MRFTTKLSRLVSTLSILLLFVFLCGFAISNLPIAQAESYSVSLQEQDDDEDDHEDDEDGDDDDEDDEHEWEHDQDELDAKGQMLELKLLFHELEARDTESEAMEMEMMGQLFEVLEDSSKTSFFAIMTIDELMDEEEAVEVLEGCLKETKNPVVQRAIRMKLIELKSEMDEPESVSAHLRALILEKRLFP